MHLHIPWAKVARCAVSGFCAKNDGFCFEMMNFVLKMIDYVLKMMDFCGKDDALCATNDGFCIKCDVCLHKNTIGLLGQVGQTRSVGR